MSQSTSAAGAHGRYDQELHRALHVLGNVLITLSAITPAVSVFVIAPVAFAGQGSGAFLAFVIAAVIGIGMAMCWAELGSAYPIAGGDYSIAARELGPYVGFLMFVLFLTLIIFIPSAIALGGAAYLSVIVPGANANVVGAAIMIVTAGIALLTIRLNAIVTGIFLAIELAALVVVCILGFGHAQNWHYLVAPTLFSADGTAVPAAVGVVGTGIAVAIFSYNGYNGPIFFSEETAGHRSRIARAVYWAFGLTIAAELIPVTAALLGAPSLAKLTNASSPMAYLLETLGGHGLNVAVSLGVFLAVINATLAIILSYARIVYSSARDNAWPGVVSQWMAYVNPRFRSPWVATAVVGVVGAGLTYFSNIAALVTFTGVVLCVDYALIAVSAIVSRIRRKDLERPHRMPLWPLPAIVGLAGTVYTFTQQTQRDLLIVAIIVVCATVYYFVYLYPRKKTHWIMRMAPVSSEVHGGETDTPTGVPGA